MRTRTRLGLLLVAAAALLQLAAVGHAHHVAPSHHRRTTVVGRDVAVTAPAATDTEIVAGVRDGEGRPVTREHRVVATVAVTAVAAGLTFASLALASFVLRRARRSVLTPRAPPAFA